MPEVGLQSRGHDRDLEQPTGGGAQCLVERARQQPTVSDPRGALVSLGDGERRHHDVVVREGRPEAQARLDLVAAAEAVVEVLLQRGAG